MSQPQNLRLSEIYIYPIKSLGGISLQQTEVEDRGLKYDRRWMLVDEAGKFLTQRQHAQMALLQVSIKEHGLLVTHKQDLQEPLLVPFESAQSSGPDMQVTIWDDTVIAQEVDPAVSAWFTKALGMPARLVKMPEASRRLVDNAYAAEGEIVSFADDFPFLIIGQSSLDDLNSRLEKEYIPINRFRPNFVFTGGEPFEEDQWGHLTIGDLNFYGAKPCARCVVTTIDQATGEKGQEPLRTLSTYRLKNNKVMFGQNLLHSSVGVVSVGDEVRVRTWR
ncbi:MOSC domain-containing protein [Pontibacter rugosus]|uniref:MOSC domain-containing protein n=1 Tax=Pontibacter rugosus TaxID=1745966 RepID=A0ABW3SKJ9_9BACT